ncbi:MAG: hypothetical protein ABSG88_11760 [Bradyrhizobium sp.]|jgi:uncharacterized damage-inducible protein DinB
MADRSSTLADHYRMFGRYNAWANSRLLAAAGRLSVDHTRADRGAVREAEDRRIVDFVDGLDDARIASTSKYRRVSSPQEFEQQLQPAPAHRFNHQTYHRGQVHSLLTGLVGEAPELDLQYFQRLAAETNA